MIKNIIILNDHGFIFGGASNVAIQSAIDLSKRFNVIFVYCIGPLSNELISNNIKSFKIKSPNNFILNSLVCSELDKLTNNLSKKNTIIHIHNFTKAFTISLLYWISKRKFKTYITVHDFFLFCPNGAYFNFKNNKICKMIPGSKKCFVSNCDKYNFFLKLLKYFRFIFIKCIVFKSKNFNLIAVSEYSKKILKNEFHYNKVNLIKNNFTSLRSNELFTFMDGHPIFTFLGRMDNSKGVLLLAEAARQVKIPIHFFGDGPLLDFLKKNFKENFYYGFVHQKYLNSIYKKSNCVILPSLYHEIDGLVVRESLSFDTPVIVSSTCSSKEYVIDSVNGYVFESGSQISLVDKLNLMMNNKKYERINKFLIKRKSINYNANNLKKYIELYK